MIRSVDDCRLLELFDDGGVDATQEVTRRWVNINYIGDREMDMSVGGMLPGDE